MDFREMYGEYDCIDVNTFTYLPDISCYNHNYYIGLKRKGRVTNDLIFAESDDDNLTEYYHVNGSMITYIGYEHADEGVFHLSSEKFT